MKIVCVALCFFSLILQQHAVVNAKPKPQVEELYGDYALYPKRDFTYSKAVINYKYDQENELLLGKVVYTIEPLWNDVETLKLLAFRMQIDEVRVDNELASYNLQNDSLFISLNGAKAKKQLKLEIIFQTDLYYGLHKDRFGTVWTSMQPYATAHYLPGFIHPRNRLLTEVTFDVPKDHLVAAPGKLYRADVQNTTDRRIVEWKTEVPISITDFKFAMGRFETEDLQFGAKKIRLFSAVNMLSKEARTSFVAKTYQHLKKVEDALSAEYPFQTMSVVYLGDSRWETKSYAASLGFVFQNEGFVDEQLERNATAQWFGVSKQVEQWKSAAYDVFWQAWVKAQFIKNEKTSLPSFEQKNGVETSSFHIQMYLEQVKRFLDEKNARWFFGYESSVAHLLQMKRSIVVPREHQEMIYKNTGRTFTELEATVDSVKAFKKVWVAFTPFEGQKKLQVKIKRDSSEIKSEQVELILVTGKSRSVKKINLSNATDSQLVDMPADLKNAYINFKNEVYLSEYTKPVEFWLNQLRDEKASDLRWQAVLAIKNQESNNADIQLLLFDLLKTETEPQIKAVLIELYAQLTKGATGTDAYFLEEFRNESPEIKKAALTAFGYFPENEPMILNAQAVLKNGALLEIKIQALETLNLIMEKQAFTSYLIRFLKSNKSTQLVIPVLKKLEILLEPNEYLSLLTDYASTVYPFEIRQFCLLSYLEKAEMGSETNEKMNTWILDYDPRIRYAMLNNLYRFPTEFQVAVLKDRSMDEYDTRLRILIAQLMKSKLLR